IQISMFRIKNNLFNKVLGATFCVVGVHFKRKACDGRRLFLFENVFKSIVDFKFGDNGLPHRRAIGYTKAAPPLLVYSPEVHSLSLSFLADDRTREVRTVLDAKRQAATHLLVAK